MCWITKNKPIKLIANKDIPTFKIGMINTKGMEVPLLVLTKEKDGKETIWETTKNGKIYMPRKGNIQALYVRYLKK